MKWYQSLIEVMEDKEVNINECTHWRLSNTTYIRYSWFTEHGRTYTSLHEVKRGIKRLIDDKRALVLLRRHLPKGEFEALQLKHELCQ